MTLHDFTLSSSQLKAHLRLLEIEQQQALASSLAHDTHYMADLRDELDATLTAFTTARVIEIARRRCSSSCRPHG
jgi:hypothetical protein